MTCLRGPCCLLGLLGTGATQGVKSVRRARKPSKCTDQELLCDQKLLCSCVLVSEAKRDDVML